MKKIFCLFAFALSFAAFSSYASDTQAATEFGNWTIVQAADGAANQKACSAIYKHDLMIQASTAGIHVGNRSGVKAYSVRVDDQPARDVYTGEGQKPIGAATVSFKDFALLKAAHVSIKMLTGVDSIVVQDIDMDGFRSAFDYFSKQGC